jgi:hypothetical protein
MGRDTAGPALWPLAGHVDCGLKYL